MDNPFMGMNKYDIIKTINNMSIEQYCDLFESKYFFSIIEILPFVDLSIKKNVMDIASICNYSYIIEMMIRKCQDCAIYYYNEDLDFNDKTMFYGFFLSGFDRKCFNERMIYVDYELKTKLKKYCDDDNYDMLVLKKREMMGNVMTLNDLNSNYPYYNLECLNGVVYDIMEIF